VVQEKLASIVYFVVIFASIAIYGAIASFIAVKGKKFNPKVQRNYEHEPTVSVVIPTYNEEKIIEKKIKNILTLSYPKEKLELVIIDCSDDRTPEIVQECQKRSQNIRLIKQEKRTGLADALNIAYEEANGEIVIKSDCDSFVLKKDGIRGIVSYFADPMIGGVCGIRITARNEPDSLRSIERNFRNLQVRLQIAESNIDSTIVAHGSFAAFRKRLIEKIDTTSAADDTELFVKIRKKGYRTIINPEVTTYEPAEENILKRRKQMDRRTQGIIKVLLQNVNILFNVRYGAYAFLIFPLNLFMLVLSPYLLMVDLAVFLFLCLPFFQLVGTVVIFFIILSLIILTYKVKLIPPVAAFIDVQVSALLAGLKLLFRGTEYKWEKTRPSEISLPCSA